MLLLIYPKKVNFNLGDRKHVIACLCMGNIGHSFDVVMQEQDVKLSELESENRKMKVELEEFRTEATHLKNQQATIRRLEERNRQLEQQVGTDYHSYGGTSNT